jgi:hypothetical protein
MSGMSEMPLEGSSEDIVEQRAEVYPQRGGQVATADERPLEADPADARDQADEVPLDDEEWQ